MGNMGKEKGCKLICWKPATWRIDKYFLVGSYPVSGAVERPLFNISSWPYLSFSKNSGGDVDIDNRDDTTDKDDDGDDDDNHAKDVLKPCRLIPWLVPIFILLDPHLDNMMTMMIIASTFNSLNKCWYINGLIRQKKKVCDNEANLIMMVSMDIG